MVDEVLPRVAQLPGIAGCHLLVADESASAVETAEKKVRAEKNLIPRWIVLVESWGDDDPFMALCRDLVLDVGFADATSRPTLGIYRLQNARSKLASVAT